MQKETQLNLFDTSDTVFFVNNSGINTGAFGAGNTGTTPATAVDWYDQQTLGLTNTTLFWKSIAPKPVSNVYVTDRNGKNDGIHVAVVDDLGSITGTQGSLLEKHVSLSKAVDAVSNVNPPTKTWYEGYVADFSEYVYAGSNPSSAADSYHGTVPVRNWILCRFHRSHNWRWSLGSGSTRRYLCCNW